MKIKTQLKIKGKQVKAQVKVQVKVQVKNRRKQLSPTRSTDARSVTGVSSPTARPTTPKPTPAVAEATTSTITETTTAAATAATAPTKPTTAAATAAAGPVLVWSARRARSGPTKPTTTAPIGKPTKSPPKRKYRPNRPCDKRQRTSHRVMTLFNKCRVGDLFRMALNKDGHQVMGQRERVTHVLRFLFGKTFDSKSYYWLENPDTNLFIANMLHLASAGKVSKDADLSGLFFQDEKCLRRNNRFKVNTDVLEAAKFPLAELGKALRQWCIAASRGAPVCVSSPVA
jgi:hypothetical protein